MEENVIKLAREMFPDSVIRGSMILIGSESEERISGYLYVDKDENLFFLHNDLMYKGNIPTPLEWWKRISKLWECEYSWSLEPADDYLPESFIRSQELIAAYEIC